MASKVDSDVLIVGGGHAGLAAALTLYRAQHTSTIFNSDAALKKWACPTHSLPGWEHGDTQAIKERARKELRDTGLVRFVETKVTSIRKLDDGSFTVCNAEGKAWTGHKLLLAVGKDVVYPEIMGYAQAFSDGIYHCMLTFGYEQRNTKTAGMLAREHLATPFHLSMVLDDTQKFVHQVTIYTDGNSKVTEEVKAIVEEKGALLDSRKIAALAKLPEGSKMRITFEDGESVEEGFLVHQPFSKVDETFVNGLGLKLSSWGDIEVHPLFCGSSVPGVYAAGDCAGPVKTILNALNMGTNAGAGLARELPRKLTGHGPAYADWVIEQGLPARNVNA